MLIQTLIKHRLSSTFLFFIYLSNYLSLLINKHLLLVALHDYSAVKQHQNIKK